MSKGASYGEGVYWVKAISQTFGQSKNKKTPEFSLRFEVQGKVDKANPDGDLIRCDQNERTLYIYITEKTAEFAIEDLQRIGYDKPSFRFLDPNIAGFYDFTNYEFEAYCKHEEYQGQTKERWSIARPRQAREVAPLEDKEVRKLDSLFGKQLSKAPKPTGKKPDGEKPGELAGVSPSQRSNAGTGREDATKPPTPDEIPF